jgi:prepilin-type N-terminal cleavage/methylation domain-containing protein
MRTARGFTLLEMMIATVLSSVLLIGVLAVVANLGKSANAVGLGRSEDFAAVSGAEAVRAWEPLLRDDMAGAAAVDATKANELTLVGYGALDATSRRRVHRPVRVVYEIAELDGRRWLIRRQTALDVLTDQNVQRDLVCSGVTRFALARVAEAPGATTSPSGKGWSRWRLQVWMDGAEPVLDRTFAAQAAGGQ